MRIRMKGNELNKQNSRPTKITSFGVRVASFGRLGRAALLRVERSIRAQTRNVASRGISQDQSTVQSKSGPKLARGVLVDPGSFQHTVYVDETTCMTRLRSTQTWAIHRVKRVNDETEHIDLEHEESEQNEVNE